MSVKPGGWSSEAPVSAEKKAIFDKAVSGILGVKYHDPVAVAFQLVNGTKYMFLAEYTTVTAEPQSGMAVLYILAVPAGADPVVHSIQLFN